MSTRKHRYRVRAGDRELEVAVEPAADGRYAVRSGDEAIEGITVSQKGPTLVVRIGERVLEVAPGEDGTFFLPGGEALGLRAERRGMGGRTADAGGPSTVQAPMPGRVIKVLVAEGDVVQAGGGLVVIEAMKMENEIDAPRGGTVQRLLVAVGDAVERDAPLVELG
jgi:biotin carboxyl carrier protein